MHAKILRRIMAYREQQEQRTATRVGKKWWVMALLVLSGCTSEPMQWYLLPATSAPVVAEPTAPLLVVRSVELAPYLNGNGLVYRTSETQLLQTQRNLWAQDLPAQLTQRIVTDLRSKQTHYWAVAHNPMMKTLDQPTLLVRIDQFNGAYTGNAEIRGEWSVVDGAGKLQQTHAFRYQIPQSDDGYPALVEALSQGFEQVTTQIADKL